MPIHDHEWLSPPADQTLSSREIHVWRVALDRPAAAIQCLVEILSPDERARAERFYFEEDRQRFIAGRGTLRQILSNYLHVPPKHLQFQYGAYGKPALANAAGRSSLRFNVSHSRGLALCAFVLDREIGIDLEYMRPLDDVEQIARHFFSVRESEQLFALPIERQLAAFYNCWTRKEACIKAWGDGLVHPLDRFFCSLAPGEPAQLVSVNYDLTAGRRWLVQALTPAPNYAAALAIEGRDWHVTCWQWPEG